MYSITIPDFRHCTKYTGENTSNRNSVADLTVEQSDNNHGEISRLEDDVTTMSESVCTSKPTVEVVRAHSNIATEQHIQPTTQKLTVLRINQLVHKAEKWLATHQDLPTGIMETNMQSAGQENATNEQNPTLSTASQSLTKTINL